jgi:DNA-binding SARP family transcriptional activator
MTVHLLARPRLIELMGARWQLDAVVVAAGPGFGKSVLLTQAMSENLLAPRGVDVFVGCHEGDCMPGHFLRRIADSAGLEGVPVHEMVSAEWLLAELGRRWPLGVCVVVDDVHHVCAREDGARLVSRLVSDAPSSVHFVLAGRTRPRGLARARLAGEVLEIGEDQLSLSSAETVELARLHRVDPSVPAAVGGWPAAASMAASFGIHGADEYVIEAVLDQLDADARRTLAIAAAIGGGDADVLHRAIGQSAIEPAELLARLPLVSLSDRGEHEVHDLWRRVIGNAIPADELRQAVARGVDAWVERGQFDRAFRLCVAHGDWDHAASVLTACCRRGHAEVLPEVLAGWLFSLPTDRCDEPEGLLLRGLVGRVTDPFGLETAELLERAVESYRAIGNVAGEVAAGVELVYVLRNQGRWEALPVFLARALELDAAGHVEVTGPAAVARALLAELCGDDRQFVEQLDAVPLGFLSRDWQTVVAFRKTIAHLTLGDQHEMLEAATHCARLAVGSNERHVLSLAQWFAGRPSPALQVCDEITDDARRSQVDAVILGSLSTMVLATAGRLDEAAAQLAFTERAASGPVSPFMRGALIGVRALVAAAMTDEDRARVIIEEALADAPLADPVGWRTAVTWLPLAYVLVPSVRAELDGRAMGAVHQRRLDVARAVAWATEGRSLRPAALDAITPEAVATSVPLPWAMVLAARLAADGMSKGRQIAKFSLECIGEPAREALRNTTSHPVKRIADGARKLLAAIAITPRHPVRLALLGPIELQVGGGETLNMHWNRERVRLLFLYLVLHGPAHREQITDALWPHLDLRAADQNLRVTLTYLHQVLEPERCNGEAPFFIRQTGPTLSLAGGSHLEVDAHTFRALIDRAEDADHRGLPSVALELFEQALQHWRGPCLSDVAYEEWAQAACRELTARYVGAALRAAELHLAAGNSTAAVNRARGALLADEWSEPAHRILVAAALASGDRCGAARALADNDAMLASLGIAACPQTEMLRRRLYEGQPQAVGSAMA